MTIIPFGPQSAPLPDNEAERLAALSRCCVIDTAPEPSYDAIVELVASIAGTPIALVSLLDETRQWFKARVGLAASQTPRSQAFCGYTITSNEVLVVEDAARDPRFADNPLVTGHPHIRFYCGIPLVVAPGIRLGSLCAIDIEPRTMSSFALQQLRSLAQITAEMLRARSVANDLQIARDYRRMIEEAAQIGFWSRDPKGRLTEVSPGLATMLNGDTAPSGDDQKLAIERPEWQKLLRAADGGTDHEIRDEVLNNSDPDKARHLRLVTRTSGEGSERREHGVVLDQTEMKSALTRAAENEALLNAFIDGAPAALAMFDRDMRYLRANAQWCADYGLEAETLIGRKHYDVFPEIPARWKAHHQRAMSGESLRSEKDLFLRSDGARQWLSWELRPWRLADGSIGGILMFTRDITARVASQEALAVSERRMELVLSIASLSVWEIDFAAQRVEMPVDFLALCGHNFDARALLADHFAYVLEEDRPAVDAAWAEHLASRKPFRVQHRVALADGRIIWLSCCAYAFSDANGKLTRILGVSQNITAQKDQERNLLEAHAAVIRANEAKTQFLANMSHEIRTPLNGIIGLSEALSRQAATDTQRELANLVVSSGRALEALVSDVLDLSKIEAGHVIINPVEFDVRALVESVCDLFRSRAQGKGIALVADFPDGVGTRVFADLPRLRQVLSNLVSNAVKFTDTGQVTVSVSMADDPSGVLPSLLAIEVADTGIGFTTETRDRLFERFTQGDESITRRFGGTGLGLAIARDLSRLMGGDIQCWGEPEKGATFLLKIPVQRRGDAVYDLAELTDANAAGQADAAAGAQQDDEDAPTADGFAPGLRVLVAEDHPTNRRVLEVLLEAASCELHLVENGAEAVEAFAAHGPFDIVLMDMQMPVLDGLTATRQIRLYEHLHAVPPTPIMMITANAMPQDVRACLDAGADCHFPKPINAHALLQTIATMTAGTDDQSAPGANDAMQG